MKVCFSILLFLITFPLFSGMDFILISENESDSCEMYFPDGLAYFAERVGKYGENSEFKQVENILDVNLDVFNHLLYKFDEEGEIETNWFDIDSTIKLLNSVLKKIDSNTNFYKGVIYDTTFKNKDEWRKKTNSVFLNLSKAKWELDNDSITELEFSTEVEKVYNLELTFPAYDDYLEMGSLVKDLKSFIDILNCSKKAGNNKIGIIYM